MRERRGRERWGVEGAGGQTDGWRDTNTEDLFIWAIASHEGLQTDDLPSRKTYYSRWYGERVTERERKRKEKKTS